MRGETLLCADIGEDVMKMEKINASLHLFLIFAVIVVFSVLASDLPNEIILGDMTFSPGDTDVTVPVVLKNNDSVAGFQFDLAYTSYLIYKGYEATARMPNASVVVNNDTLGLLRVAALIEGQISAGNGTILNLVFDVNSSAASGEYPVNFSNLLLGDIVAQPVNTTPSDADFTIVVDSDGDGILDDEDVCPQTYGCSDYIGCQYGIKEWLPPITTQENFTLQDGSTLPLKFNVTNCSDYFFEDYDVKVSIYNDTLNFSKEYNASGTGDDYVRIEEVDVLYITNIHTNDLDMDLGMYTINVTLGNKISDKTGFILVEKGIGKGKKLK